MARVKSWSFAVKNQRQPSSRSSSSKFAVMGWVAPSRAPSIPSMTKGLSFSSCQNFSSISRSSATSALHYEVSWDNKANGSTFRRRRRQWQHSLFLARLPFHVRRCGGRPEARARGGAARGAEKQPSSLLGSAHEGSARLHALRALQVRHACLLYTSDAADE